MKSIFKNSSSILFINKSKFITELVKVSSIDEISISLNRIKHQYKGATHYCYAYIIENVKRFSDDGEPGGTAGMPILNVLENHDLNYILCVVVRYFGGIKLGAGGLVRAYTKAVTTCLETVTLKEVEFGYKIKIIFSYDLIKLIDNLLKEEVFILKDYNENVEYAFIISTSKYDNIKSTLDKLCFNIEKLENLII